MKRKSIAINWNRFELICKNSEPMHKWLFFFISLSLPLSIKWDNYDILLQQQNNNNNQNGFLNSDLYTRIHNKIKLEIIKKEKNLKFK